MMEVFDRASRRRVAILENAYAVSEQQRMNAVWHLNFSLPCRDPKNQFCRPFHYVRHNGGELYRIMPSALDVDEAGAVSYQCEHVLATLIDTVLFGYHVVGNLGVYTRDVIQYVLDRQLTKHWVLDRCAFRNQFEYGWENETILSALFSVAGPLKGPCIWRTDTSVYPWRLSLDRLDTAGAPELYVRRRHNMTSFHRDSEPQQVVTRLYPLGYGEGVNQLGIAGVNGGVPYLQSPKAVTDKYGVIERVWTDRRYEDPASLKAAAQAMLDGLQEPLLSYEVGFQELTQSDYDRAAVGKRVRLVLPEAGEHVDTFVTGVDRDYGDAANSTLTVANRDASIASSLADMADRQRIEMTYAQGATQIYSQTLQANCSAESGAVMDFFLPREMRIVNKVLVKVRAGRFRAYSKSTQSETARVVSSTTSDSQTWTSSGGGGGSQTSTSGGGSTATSEGGGGVTTDTGTSGINVSYDYGTTESAQGHTHQYKVVSGHQHRVALQDHKHSVRIPDHQHSVSFPSHNHTVQISGHAHNVTVPAHAHDITPGIFEFGDPQRFGLYVNGEKKADFEGRTAELDITGFLAGEDKMIPRGRWLDLEVRPDSLAYVSIGLVVQGFIQSRGDNTV